MNNMSEQITQVINTIAEKLGIAVQLVYPMLRKQALIDGIMDTFYVFIGLALIIAVIVNFRWLLKKDKNGDYIAKYWDEEWFGYSIVAVGCLGIGIMFITFFFKDALVAFINPDWYIINNILSQFVQSIK